MVQYCPLAVLTKDSTMQHIVGITGVTKKIYINT